MRGTDQQQGHVFSYISPEQRVRKDHPLRPIRAMVDKVLKELSPEFAKMYSKVGRPSIPPEQLLRKVRHRGTLKVDWIFTFACAAYNLVRMRNLMRSAIPT
jgi:hypothetical protein